MGREGEVGQGSCRMRRRYGTSLACRREGMGWEAGWGWEVWEWWVGGGMRSGGGLGHGVAIGRAITSSTEPSLSRSVLTSEPPAARSSSRWMSRR